MGSSLKARLKALSRDDSSTRQTGLVIAPFVSKEEQSCVTALVQLVRSSNSSGRKTCCCLLRGRCRWFSDAAFHFSARTGYFGD